MRKIALPLVLTLLICLTACGKAQMESRLPRNTDTGISEETSAPTPEETSAISAINGNAVDDEMEEDSYIKLHNHLRKNAFLLCRLFLTSVNPKKNQHRIVGLMHLPLMRFSSLNS